MNTNSAFYIRIADMSRAELQAWVDRAISRIKDDETRERLEGYMNEFYNDFASLAEMACDIRDGLYS